MASSDRAADPGKPYHQGELLVQAEAGSLDQARAMARGVRAHVPAPLARFLTTLPWIILGGADRAGRVWSTVLIGPPGFAHAGNTTIRLDAVPQPGDPLRDLGSGSGPEPAGLLAIDLGRRMRARINGTVHRDGETLVMAVEQAYANCMKYIARRDLSGLRHPVAAPADHRRGDRVTAGQAGIIATADTVFLASVAAGHGADVSHRGGPPGFLGYDGGSVIRFAEYPGNGMFNTLGNLRVDGRAGLCIPVFGTGSVLHLSGRAAVISGDGEFNRHTVEFHVERVIEADHALPFVFGAVEYSPFLPDRTQG